MGKWLKEWRNDGDTVEITIEEASDTIDRQYKNTEEVLQLLKDGKMRVAATTVSYVYYKPNAYEAQVNAIKEHLDEFLAAVDGKKATDDMGNRLSAKIHMDKIVEHTETLAQIFNEGR